MLPLYFVEKGIRSIAILPQLSEMVASCSFLFPLLLFLATIPHGSAAEPPPIITKNDVNAMVEAMRSSGYNLFPNAIQTSDLQNLLLATNATSLTLFLPPDAAIYDLDLNSSSAENYVRTLQHHFSTPKFSMQLLGDMAAGTRIQTLVQGQFLPITKSYDPNNSFGVLVGGVRVMAPDLFQNDRIAVHGVEGVLHVDPSEPRLLPLTATASSLSVGGNKGRRSATSNGDYRGGYRSRQSPHGHCRNDQTKACRLKRYTERSY